MMRFQAARTLAPSQWLMAPALASALLSSLFALPVSIFGFQPPEPVFPMALAFSWAVIRPSVLPPFLLTALGLFQDIITGGLLGLWPLCLLTLYAIALAFRRGLASEGFWALAAWYAVLCVVSFAAGLLLVAIDVGEVANLWGLALQYAATVALFPLAWRLIDRFEDSDVRFR